MFLGFPRLREPQTSQARQRGCTDDQTRAQGDLTVLLPSDCALGLFPALWRVTVLLAKVPGAFLKSAGAKSSNPDKLQPDLWSGAQSFAYKRFQSHCHVRPGESRRQSLLSRVAEEIVPVCQVLILNAPRYSGPNLLRGVNLFLDLIQRPYY